MRSREPQDSEIWRDRDTGELVQVTAPYEGEVHWRLLAPTYHPETGVKMKIRRCAPLSAFLSYFEPR